MSVTPRVCAAHVLAFGTVLGLAGCASDAAEPTPSTDGGVLDAPATDTAAQDGITTDVTTFDEPEALRGITAAHNEVRAVVGVPPLQWDPALAAIAQAWVETCTDTEAPIGLVDHNGNRSQGQTESVGENIYASGGTATPRDAVNSWASEKSSYDYATNTCAAGQICGHYTQIVWRTTQRLGCGLFRCSSLQYPSTIVCNYGPAGNSGGKPY
jgi:pathogenesis-related protein 1